MVPLLVALVVLVNVVGHRSGSTSGSVADVSGPTSSARDDLPVVTVQTPAVTPQADASCPAFVDALPAQMVGEPPRRVESASSYVRAWGDPASRLNGLVQLTRGLSGIVLKAKKREAVEA